MRLKILFWWRDESGLVLALSALALPVILLVGVLILQSGALYHRQAQLQFMARQAANSALIPAATVLKNQAENNHDSTCSVEFPPSICSSDNLFDFLTLSEAQGLVQQASTQIVVQQEGKNFAVATDPSTSLRNEAITVEFPYNYQGGSHAVARVVITEEQISWLGNVLRPTNYALTVEAESFLPLDA